MPTRDRPHPLVAGLRRSGLILRDERTLVAVSGGPDSTALLVALREEGHEVIAAHYDHALQPTSGLAAAQVRSLCASLGVELVVERRSEPVPRGSIQAGARRLRYAFLERAAGQVDASVVALAHTADDLVEGVVMHLLRGCGLAGLRGMPARRGRFVRPLLLVWRGEVEDFLSGRELAVVDDPANQNRAFARARVRHDILPALERDRPGLTRRLHAVALRAAEMYDANTARAAAALGAGPLSRATMTAMEPAVAAEAVRMLYARAGGVQPGLSRAHLRAIMRLTQGGRGGRGVDLPGGRRFRIVGGQVDMVSTRSADSSAAETPPTLTVKPCDGRCSGGAGAAHLRTGLDLRVGFRRPGLRMRPVGGRGSRKLQDIFVDAKIPREERDSWPLVFAGDRLAWVPGLAVDKDLASNPGEAALHVTVTRILFAGTPKTLC
jgi:tRNA(Ile)-lysidine synthetase-like protein